MKINPQFKVRNVAGENVVINTGHLNAPTTKVIVLNDTSLMLWTKLQTKNFELENVKQLLMSEYEIDQNQAIIDAQKWIDGITKAGLLEL